MSKKKGPPGLQHVGIERRALKKVHWRGLSSPAKIFYIHLKGAHDGTNNGEIKLPYRSMRGVEGCSNNRTISKAVKELKKKKWIKVKEQGGIYRHNNLYTITFRHDFYGAPSSVSRFRDKNKI